MLYFVARRLLLAIPVLLVLSIVVFVALRLTTDPLQALTNPRMTPEDRQRVAAALGLDKSGPQQYTSWLSHFVRGDWGLSLRRRTEVAPIIRERFGNTVKLMSLAVIFSMILAIAVGVFSAVRPYSKLDSTFTGISFFGISMPPFWFGLVLQIVLGLYLQRWLGKAENVFAFLPDWFGQEP